VTAPAVRDVYGEWMSMVGTTYGGRNALPGILWDHFTEGAFTIDQKDDGSPVFDTELLASAVQDAWSMAEYPQQHLEDWEWQALFLAAWEHLSHPEEPITLYRGVRDKAFAGRMSWTSSLEMARWFAARYDEGDGFVCKLTVEPYQVLARIIEGRDGEDEYVLDPEAIYDDDIELV